MSDSTTESITNDGGGGSRLLTLPAELRNTIYGYVLLDVKEPRFNERQLIPHALACVCRQSREELTPMFEHVVQTSITVLHARVRDFDFRSLIAYLKHLPWLEGTEDLALRTLDVEILITESASLTKTRRVEKWLEYCEEDVSRGMDAVTRKYSVSCPASERSNESLHLVSTTLADLWEFCDARGDTGAIKQAVEMAGIRLRKTLTGQNKTKQFARKRKRDQKDEGRVLKQT